MGKNRDTVTVKDAEGKEVDIGVYDVLGQLDIKDILWHLDPDDFLNEIGVQDAINCFGEEVVFDRVATPEMSIDPTLVNCHSAPNGPSFLMKVL